MCRGTHLVWTWQDSKRNDWDRLVVGVVEVTAMENQEWIEEEVVDSAWIYGGGSCHKIQADDPEMDTIHAPSCLDKPHRRSLRRRRRIVLVVHCPEHLTVLRLRMWGRGRWRHYTHLSCPH